MPRTNKTRAKKSVFASTQALAGREFLDAEKSLVAVRIGFQWKPETDAPVLVNTISVNGYPILKPGGIPSKGSPFVHSLGKHSKGSVIKIAWHVTSFYDIKGIKAFVAAEGAEPIGHPSKEPFPYLEVYTAEVSYRVPLD